MVERLGMGSTSKRFSTRNGHNCFKNGVDICAGFIYLTNSKVALTEFVVSNKEYREKDRGKALDFLLDCLLALAEQNGCRYAHVILKNDSLIRRYKKAGYILSDKKVTEMLKVWQ